MSKNDDDYNGAELIRISKERVAKDIKKLREAALKIPKKYKSVYDIVTEDEWVEYECASNNNVSPL